MIRTLLAAFLALALAAARAAPPADGGPRVSVLMLEHIALDYGHAVQGGDVRNPDEYREMAEFAAEVHARLAQDPLAPGAVELAGAAAHIRELVARKAEAGEVASAALALRDGLLSAHGIRTAPRTAPDEARGRALYLERCVSCHGQKGHGDGPAARGLRPPPPDMADRARMARMSPFHLYNSISVGIPGTAMPAFADLPDADRWALAFHVAFLSSPEALRQSPTRPLSLRLAQDRITESLDAYRAGNVERAASLAVEGYLQGFELLERTLAQLDHALVVATEGAFIDYRQAVRSRAPPAQVERLGARVLGLLQRGSLALQWRDLPSNAVLAATTATLLTEGIPVALLLVALFAFTRSSCPGCSRRPLHGAWLGALILGAATWALSSRVVEISGPYRERVEGLTALVIAAALAALSIAMRADALGGRFAWSAGVLLERSRPARWALAAIAFAGSYRQVFETALVLQALAAHSPERPRAIMLCASIVLLGLAGGVALLLRACKPLPASAVATGAAALLASLSVVLVGQGIGALQDAGWLPTRALPLPYWPALGVLPTLQTGASQLSVAVALAAGWILLRTRVVERRRR